MPSLKTTLVSDEDIRELRQECLTALRQETQAPVSVRQAWRQMVAMFNELLERRAGDRF